MSARDTVRETPASSGTESTAPAAASLDVANSQPEMTAPTEKKFDPFKFQTNTMPPGLRAELIAAGLPSADRRRIEDTVPPNLVVQAAVEPMPSGESTSEEQVDDSDRHGESTNARARTQRSMIPWIVGCAAALVAAVVVVAVVAVRPPAAEQQPATAIEPAPAPKVAPPTRDEASVARVAQFPAPLPAPRASVNARAPSPTRPSAPAPQPSPRAESPSDPTLQSTEEVRGQAPPAASARTNPFDKPFKPPSD
jgi:hypothetical protein